MPTLEWIGKSKVINHHLDVPYRVLDCQYTYTENGNATDESENKIIRGDNLEALKALLPQYEGKIKCIYIDPPYNTGNEGWVYNDNVSDPKIKKWLGQVVGREGEDLSRHDKWLCMMYPRLKLLQKLLADQGAIFISIDDNEVSSLRLICDEIFNSSNYVATISWRRSYAPRSDSKGISREVESIIVYSKNSGWSPHRLPRTEQMDSKYKRIDGDDRLWRTDNASAPSANTHTGMVYAIQHPLTGEYIYPPVGRCWGYGQEQMLAIMQGWSQYELRPLDDLDERQKICGAATTGVPDVINAIVLSHPFDNVKDKTWERYKTGLWPQLYFTNGGKGGIARKTYLDDKGGRVVTNLWDYSDVGHTDGASREIKTIFKGEIPFDTPKPTRLLERVLQVATDKDSIILDSFAGSGTTAHAVLNMNKQDGGNRKFILVEMMDYAETITAERVRRVIDGYADVEGTGGSFSFYDLGQPLLLENHLLNEDVPINKIREYVFYMETKRPMPQTTDADNPYYLGKNNETAYYFYYEKERVTTLGPEFLSTVKTQAEEYIVYADQCMFTLEDLKKYNIVFKKIPRDIAKL